MQLLQGEVANYLFNVHLFLHSFIEFRKSEIAHNIFIEKIWFEKWKKMTESDHATHPVNDN